MKTVMSMIDVNIQTIKHTIEKLESRIDGSTDVLSILKSITQCGYKLKVLEELKSDIKLWKVTQVGEII